MTEIEEDAEYAANALLDHIETHGVPGVDLLIEEVLSDSEMPYAAGCLMHLTHWLDIKIREGRQNEKQS